jgi:hypothetical protein
MKIAFMLRLFTFFEEFGGYFAFTVDVELEEEGLVWFSDGVELVQRARGV